MRATKTLQLNPKNSMDKVILDFIAQQGAGFNFSDFARASMYLSIVSGSQSAYFVIQNEPEKQSSDSVNTNLDNKSLIDGLF